MAQGYDKYELDNQTGQSFRFALNDILEAAATQNSGDSSPNTNNTSYPYQTWVDTTNDVVKIRDAATASSWYSLYSVDSDGKPTGAVSYGNYTIATNDTAGTGGTTALRIDTSGVIDFVGSGYTIGTNSCFIKQDSSGEGYFYNRGNNDLLFGTNNTERARIDSSGILSVTSTATNGRINVGDPDNFIYGDTSNNLILGTNASERIAINSGGLIDIKGGQILSYKSNSSFTTNATTSITVIASEAVMYQVACSMHGGGTSVGQEIGYLTFTNTAGGYVYNQTVSNASITISVSYTVVGTATVTATGPGSTQILYLKLLRI